MLQVDALVDHFTRFAADERELPTVWHQALLTFVQRYKHEIRADDKAALKRLMKTQHHYQVHAPGFMMFKLAGCSRPYRVPYLCM